MFQHVSEDRSVGGDRLRAQDRIESNDICRCTFICEPRRAKPFVTCHGFISAITICALLGTFVPRLMCSPHRYYLLFICCYRADLPLFPHFSQTMGVVGILNDDVDPMVNVMKVDKAPMESYSDVGGLQDQIQEVKVGEQHRCVRVASCVSFVPSVTLFLSCRILTTVPVAAFDLCLLN